jgi:hypothetical protein
MVVKMPRGPSTLLRRAVPDRCDLMLLAIIALTARSTAALGLKLGTCCAILRGPSGKRNS